MASTRPDSPWLGLSLTEVLVVGAGPTGLMSALQLARHGVAVRIIDVQDARTDESRAIGIQARTVELFDQLGLAERLLAHATHGEPATLHFRGTEASLGFEAIAHATRFPSLYLIPQAETEALLAEALRAHGVTVDRPRRLHGFVQDASGVTADVVDRRTGMRETIRSRYLVGCDGAHSRVRDVLGIRFEGATYPQEFVLADAHVTGAAPGLSLYLAKRAALVVAPMGEVTRLIGVRFDRPAPDDDVPVTVDELVALARAAQAPIELGGLAWTGRFRVHHRATRRYRDGRAFLAGDACHIHTPLGGQGMNTGLQDATNLAWKLALVLRGGPPALLDTYEAERQRVGEILVRTTDRLFGYVTSRRPVIRALRDLLVPTLAPRLLASPRVRREIVRFLSQLDIRYHQSRFVCEAAATDAALPGGPAAGCRMPDLDLEGGPLYAWLREPWLHVLAAGDVDDTAALERRFATTTRVHRIAARPENRAALERLGVTRAAVYVIRPDGHVGFRSAGPGLEAVERYLAELTAGAARPAGTRTAPSRIAPTAHPRSSPVRRWTPAPPRSRGRR